MAFWCMLPWQKGNKVIQNMDVKSGPEIAKIKGENMRKPDTSCLGQHLVSHVHFFSASIKTPLQLLPEFCIFLFWGNEMHEEWAHGPKISAMPVSCYLHIVHFVATHVQQRSFPQFFWREIEGSAFCFWACTHCLSQTAFLLLTPMSLPSLHNLSSWINITTWFGGYTSLTKLWFKIAISVFNWPPQKLFWRRRWSLQRTTLALVGSLSLILQHRN